MGKENHSDKIVWDVLGRGVLKANKPFFFFFLVLHLLGHRFWCAEEYCKGLSCCMGWKSSQHFGLEILSVSVS